MEHKRRYHGPLVESKHTKWRRPIRKKTAVELLERADKGEISMTQKQRAVFLERAGKNYKPISSDPLERRKGESVEDYLARLKKMFSDKGGKQ